MLLGALIGWFWLRVARGLREGIDEGDLLAWFLVAFPLFVILINLHPSYLLLTFIAYWQLYAYLRIPAASVGAVVLTAALWVSTTGADALSPVAVVIGGMALLVSTMFAAYIEALGREAEKRQVLIDQLRATRDDLAAAEREAGRLAERQRLAGEIHDTLAHGFTSIVISLEAAETHLGARQAT
ncbi:MAG: hypothetical protein H0W06_07780, partial [Chloroflexia bacterium]|nr:hypothetical protein [Chloroflexia bacterium]